MEYCEASGAIRSNAISDFLLSIGDRLSHVNLESPSRRVYII